MLYTYIKKKAARAPHRVAVQDMLQQANQNYRSHATAQMIGRLLQTLGPAALGAVLGAISTEGKASWGAVKGGLAGLGIGMGTKLLGRAAARIAIKRTSRDQLKHQQGSPLANYIIPGVASFNSEQRQRQQQAPQKFGQTIAGMGAFNV